MADAELISWDPDAQVAQYLHATDDDEFVIETRAPGNELIASANAEDFKQYDERANWKGELHKVASIPLEVFYRIPLDIRRDERALRKWIDENPWVKTRPGKLSK
jgi:hypothetical protein